MCMSTKILLLTQISDPKKNLLRHTLLHFTLQIGPVKVTKTDCHKNHNSDMGDFFCVLLSGNYLAIEGNRKRVWRGQTNQTIEKSARQIPPDKSDNRKVGQVSNFGVIWELKLKLDWVILTFRLDLQPATILILALLYSRFDIQYSTLNLCYSISNIQYLTFNTWYSISNIPYSMFNIQYLMINNSNFWHHGAKSEISLSYISEYIHLTLHSQSHTPTPAVAKVNYPLPL